MKRFLILALAALLCVPNVAMAEESEPAATVEPAAIAEPAGEPMLLSTAVNRANYQPKQLRASPKNDNALVLNWRNPKTNDISLIEVYQVINGEDVLLTNTIDKTSDAIIYYEVANLDPNTAYQFKVIFSFTGQESDTYYITGTTQTGNANIVTQLGDSGGWNFRVIRGANNFCPASWKIDTETFKNGSAALKIESITGGSGRRYIQVDQVIGLTLGKKYSVSFWTKTENTDRRYVIDMGWTTKREVFDGSDGNIGKTQGTTTGSTQTDATTTVVTNDGWIKKEYTYTYATNGGNNMRIQFENMKCDAIWLDDIEIFELDENNQRTGSNLVKNGDFEGLVSTATGSILSASMTSDEDGTKLSWEKPGSNYNGANIYQKVDGSFEFRGRVAKDITELYIPELLKDTDYTFKVVPVNADGYEDTSKGAVASVKTYLADYEAYEPEFFSGTQKVESLSGAGTYTVKIPVKNNTLADGFICEVIVAVYKDGVLMDLITSVETVLQTPYNDEPGTIDITVPVSEAGSSIDCYLIDSRGMLSSYTEASIN